MKTTVDISDSLLRRAKERAAREGVTLRALIERGLRQILEEAEQRPAFKLRRASFRGKGLQPGLKDESWEYIRDTSYRCRGS